MEIKKVESTESKENCSSDMEIIQELRKEIDLLYEQIHQKYMDAEENKEQ